MSVARCTLNVRSRKISQAGARPSATACSSAWNKAAAALKSHFGARRVILFGSLVDADRFTAESDVDLAVEGLDPFDRWDAWWLCEEFIEDRKVDLVPIELADESVADSIERQGIEI